MTQPKKTLQLALTTLALMALPLAAWAGPDVKIAIKAEKEVIATENGQKVKKLVETKDILSGETITYTLNYRNAGNEAATDVVLTDPVPEGASYIAGSASEVGDLVFSIDGGKSYKRPSLLSYEVDLPGGKKEKRIASPEQYTHIRWVLPKVAAGETGAVKFQVKVK